VTEQMVEERYIQPDQIESDFQTVQDTKETLNPKVHEEGKILSRIPTPELDSDEPDGYLPGMDHRRNRKF
jgi:hypothetical protein